MSEQKILVIDDSKTIRRLCDNELSSAGYIVLLAPTAEEGVASALEQKPDLIILDHQLPGTTGYEVCVQLLANTDTAKIPVVASSTLRKKAYAEYVDCDNVVDMLPKPYSPDALIATVENALNTAAMVVQSQYEGSAVPEVINELGEASIAGDFGCFGLREIVDLLNNGNKTGTLEVEIQGARIFVFVSGGRIQAVTASGISPETIADQMPEALAELAPVIKFTLAGRKGSEVNGLVELLNNKVLDPRLLKKMLRLQAAILLRTAFTSQLKSFRFNQSQRLPPLFEKLPLEGSLLGLVVEGCLVCDVDEVPQYDDNIGFVRKTLRGQNMDRAGLSSRHMQLMSVVAEPISIKQIAAQISWPEEEVRRVVSGFELAQLIEQCQVSNLMKVFGVISEPSLATNVGGFFQANKDKLNGRIVRDLLALRLLLRRARPDVLVLQNSDVVVEFLNENQNELSNVHVVGVGVANASGNEPFDVVIEGDCTTQQLAETFGHLASTEMPAPIAAANVASETTSTCETTEV
jgi:CheY-like chemotaxis protein